MKKFILKNLKVLVIAIVVLFTTSVLAQITVPNLIYTDTTTSQIKSGGLSSNNFIANQDSAFNQNVTFDGNIIGKSITSTTAQLSIKTESNGATNMYVNGNVYVSDGDVYIKNITPYPTKPNLPVKLCANGTGLIVACP